LKLIQIPTTLLAMVDSSIGGKTGVNIEKGKNIVGTFYQPQFVYIDTAFLKTLDSKQLRNGMAEIIKYAVSFDEKFFAALNSLFDKT
jgi:3-dehydroquinate synthase